MGKTHRDKKFLIIPQTFHQVNSGMSTDKFKEMLDGVGMLNPNYYILLKEYNVRNHLGFMSNYRPFAHRHAGDRKANMRGEKVISRSKKRSEKNKVSSQIKADTEEWQLLK